jgi:hypothetical protein
MRIQVAYDSDGRIMAAVPNADGDSELAAHVASESGASVGHFDVPAEFEGKKFHDFIHLVKVDTAAMRLTATSDDLLS